jgi:pimeloyl-ACP methyl ester carboxylesterase
VAFQEQATGHQLALADERTIAFREYGDPAGRPVIALHGTPGSSLKYSGSHEAAIRAGVRLIAVDRWGYGGTSPKLGARLADYGADIAALADALKLRRFGITGVSGGAPFAVATAAALKDRITALALVSPVGPIAGHTPSVKLSAFHTLCFRILPHLPGAIAGVFMAFRTGLAFAPDLAMALSVRQSARVDQQAMANDETRLRLCHAFLHGLSRGVHGPKVDLTLFGQPWNIAFKAVTSPVCIWMGLEDRNVPLAAVYALSGALSDCETKFMPDSGHLWVATNADIVVAWLANPRV